jgi:hypothetical protein
MDEILFRSRIPLGQHRVDRFSRVYKVFHHRNVSTAKRCTVYMGLNGVFHFFIGFPFVLNMYMVVHL